MNFWDWLEDADQRLFLFLNGINAPWVDVIMSLLSGKWIWIPLYALILVWLFSIYREKVWRPVLGITLLIVLTDRISSGYFKPTFKRLRPCHTPEIASKVHVVDGCGGQWGFMSSHAANTFGFAMLLWLILHKRHPTVAWMFAWAVLVSYSRIYNGVHYPLDVLAGFGLGAACAFLIVWVFSKIPGLSLAAPALKS